MKPISRRAFLKTFAAGSVATGFPNLAWGTDRLPGTIKPSLTVKPVVSVVRIENNNIDEAVRKAIDLIGGVKDVCAGKTRILIKPNLVTSDERDTTNPEVIRSLARLMQKAGKDVVIGEGTAMGPGNFKTSAIGNFCSTKNTDMLNEIQRHAFDTLGYTALARSLKIPLINLHVGNMVRVPLSDGFVFKEIMLHQALVQSDLVCSVPVMKTHGLAGVTLGMKNLFGAFPGQVYGTVRSFVHKKASKVDPSGTASAVVDMVRACKPGLTVIDATMSMQGQGPTTKGGGILVKTDLIIAGTHPLATDMVGAAIMGFSPQEISTFKWAWQAGMSPTGVDAIEIRGEPIASVKQPFMRPRIVPYSFIEGFGPPC